MLSNFMGTKDPGRVCFHLFLTIPQMRTIRQMRGPIVVVVTLLAMATVANADATYVTKCTCPSGCFFMVKTETLWPTRCSARGSSTYLRPRSSLPAWVLRRGGFVMSMIPVNVCKTRMFLRRGKTWTIPVGDFHVALEITVKTGSAPPSFFYRGGVLDVPCA